MTTTLWERFLNGGGGTTRELAPCPIEFIKTKASEERGPLDLLDARLFIWSDRDTDEPKHALVVTFNDTASDFWWKQKAEWESLHISPHERYTAYELRVLQPADDVQDFQWVLTSAQRNC